MDAPGRHIGTTVALSSGSALLAFAAAIAAFHNIPGVSGQAGDWIDLVTPFAVLAAAAGLLFVLGASGWPLVLAIVAGIAYIDGHGIHLAANSIAREPLLGEAEDVAHFWDEQFGHIEWHLGWLALLAAFAIAEQRRPSGREVNWLVAAIAAVLLGFTLFTSTVEGGTWWLTLAGAAGFTAWAATTRRPLVTTIAAAFLFGALLIGVWALWQGGVPEFSEAGFL